MSIFKDCRFPIRSIAERIENQIGQRSNYGPYEHLANVCDVNAKVYLVMLSSSPFVFGAAAYLKSALLADEAQFLQGTVWLAGGACFCFLGFFIWTRSKMYIGPLPIDHCLLLTYLNYLLLVLCFLALGIGFLLMFS